MPRRIAIAGVSGSGKSTLARALAARIGAPYQEIDALHWGADWSARASFADDVERFTAQPRWVIEWQYHEVRALIAARADTLLFLDYPTALVMNRVIRRTFRRSLSRESLWNGNVEPPLHTFFTDRDHIIRWAWRTRGHWRRLVGALADRQPELRIVRLSRPADVERYLEEFGR